MNLPRLALGLLLAWPTSVSATIPLCVGMILNEAQLLEISHDSPMEAWASQLKRNHFMPPQERVEIPLPLLQKHGTWLIAATSAINRTVPGWAYTTFFARLNERLIQTMGKPLAREFTEATLFAPNHPVDLSQWTPSFPSLFQIESFCTFNEGLTSVMHGRENPETLAEVLTDNTVMSSVFSAFDDLHRFMDAKDPYDYFRREWSKSGNYRENGQRLYARWDKATAEMGPNLSSEEIYDADAAYLPILVEKDDFPLLESHSPRKLIITVMHATAKQTAMHVPPTEVKIRVLLLKIPKAVQQATLQDLKTLMDLGD